MSNLFRILISVGHKTCDFSLSQVTLMYQVSDSNVFIKHMPASDRHTHTHIHTRDLQWLYQCSRWSTAAFNTHTHTHTHMHIHTARDTQMSICGTMYITSTKI